MTRNGWKWEGNKNRNLWIRHEREPLNVRNEKPSTFCLDLQFSYLSWMKWISMKQSNIKKAHETTEKSAIYPFACFGKMRANKCYLKHIFHMNGKYNCVWMENDKLLPSFFIQSKFQENWQQESKNHLNYCLQNDNNNKTNSYHSLISKNCRLMHTKNKRQKYLFHSISLLPCARVNFIQFMLVCRLSFELSLVQISSGRRIRYIKICYLAIVNHLI